jgi:lysozyme
MLHRALRIDALVIAAIFSPLVAGCGAGGDGDGPLGAAQEASVCAAGAVVKGVDVSVYQDTVDWPTVKANGIDFAIARISDGSFLDTQFDANWSGMKSAGLVRGAYQFFEPGEDPTTQANIVINAVGTLGDGDLPVTADMEVTGGQSAGTIVANLQTWVAKVQAGTGKVPMIYTAEGYWDGSVGGSGAFGSLPLWVANWGPPCPNLPSGWSNWKVWQYSDSGSVPGIPTTVDLDEFNGDLSALQSFAGGGPDWGASYVSQSWPLATMTMKMTVNQVMPANIVLKNIGQKSWDGSTRLGTTQPRDRSSPFAGSDWIGPNRPAGVPSGMTIPPGGTYKFTFNFHAPGTPGMFDEFYGVLEEGVHWFSDPGQGGPPDNDIEAKIEVDEAQYHGQYVSQSWPTLQQAPVQLSVGQTMHGTMVLKNVGTATWKAGVTKLAPTPRDKPSPLAASTWLSPTRVSTISADVPPGQSATFELDLTGNTSGDYTQTFSLVEESVTWFADAPLGGGPPDDFLAVHVVVGSGATGSSSSGGGAGGGGAGGAGGGSNAETSSSGHSGSSSGGVTVTASGKCSCEVAGDRGQGEGAAWLATAGALVLARRRRRR